MPPPRSPRRAGSRAAFVWWWRGWPNLWGRADGRPAPRRGGQQRRDPRPVRRGAARDRPRHRLELPSRPSSPSATASRSSLHVVVDGVEHAEGSTSTPTLLRALRGGDPRGLHRGAQPGCRRRGLPAWRPTRRRPRCCRSTSARPCRGPSTALPPRPGQPRPRPPGRHGHGQLRHHLLSVGGRGRARAGRRVEEAAAVAGAPRPRSATSSSSGPDLVRGSGRHAAAAVAADQTADPADAVPVLSLVGGTVEVVATAADLDAALSDRQRRAAHERLDPELHGLARPNACLRRDGAVEHREHAHREWVERTDSRAWGFW